MHTYLNFTMNKIKIVPLAIPKHRPAGTIKTLALKGTNCLYGLYKSRNSDVVMVEINIILKQKSRRDGVLVI